MATEGLVGILRRGLHGLQEIVPGGQQNGQDVKDPEECLSDHTQLTGAKRREFSGMIPVITSNNHPIPQFPCVPY